MIEGRVFPVPQVAEHGPGFHVVAVDHVQQRPVFQAAGLLQEQGPVGVMVALVIALEIIGIVPLYESTILPLNL